jgi:hypothetical protein
MPKAELNMLNEQQLVPIPQSYEGMLLSRPSSTIGINIFGELHTKV